MSCCCIEGSRVAKLRDVASTSASIARPRPRRVLRAVHGIAAVLCEMDAVFGCRMADRVSRAVTVRLVKM